MLEIAPEFFEAETRMEFYIEAEMKRAWANELNVLSEVDRICTRHGIPYFAYYGTLLGAVRHRGFIPWDDDIDLAMKRKDFLTFLEYAKRELPEAFCIKSFYVNPENTNPIHAVLNRTDIGKNNALTSQYYDCPYICGLDIYVLDGIPQDLEQAQMQHSLYNIFYDLTNQFEIYQADGTLEDLLAQVKDLVGIDFVRDRTLKAQIWKAAEAVAQMFDVSECDRLVWMPDRVLGPDGKNHPIEAFSQTVRLPFETLTVSAPAGYEDVLSGLYGENWHICDKSGAAHDYPFYRKQNEWMEQNSSAET